MQINLVVEGLRFMILGMSSVFAFLIVLIFVLKFQSKLLAILGLNQPTFSTTPSLEKSVQLSDDTNVNSEVIAAISIAVDKFRSQK